MKKLGYWLATVALAVICVCALVACGGGVEGKYKFYSAKMGDEEIKAGQEFEGEKMDKNDFVIDIQADNKVVITMKALGEEVSDEGTWEINEDETELTFKGFKSVGVAFTKAKLDGGKLILDMGFGVEYTFKK